MRKSFSIKYELSSISQAGIERLKFISVFNKIDSDVQIIKINGLAMFKNNSLTSSDVVVLHQRE